MILRITADEIETRLGDFFGKIADFFIDIFDNVLEAFDKFFPREVTIMILVVLLALVVIYIFTQKINK